MGFFGRLRALVRAKPNAPQSDRIIRPIYPRLSNTFVNEFVALNYSAVFLATRIISETLACAPWHVFRRIAENERERLIDHPVDYLLSVQANPETDAFSWVRTVGGHLCTWGNHYSEIERNGSGQPVALWQISPERVKPFRRENGSIAYRVKDPDGGRFVDIPARDMFHAKGLGFDGLVGYSPLRLAREAISLGLSAERFGESFFDNDARSSLALTHPGRLDREVQERLRDSISEQHAGPVNAWKPLVLEEGMDVKTLSVPGKDAQFLETRSFQVVEIARWYRIPPHKLMELSKATFSNIEEQNREFATDAILPWARSLESEARIKLIGSDRALFTKLNLNGLMRGNMDARSSFYNTMTNIGAITPNEVRAFEDMNPIEGGDERVIPKNMGPGQGAGAPQDENEPEQPEQRGAIGAAFRKLFFEELKRSITKETKATSRAAKKYSDRDEFLKWLMEFYSAHEIHMRKSIDVIGSSLCTLINEQHDPQKTRKWVDTWIQRSVALVHQCYDASAIETLESALDESASIVSAEMIADFLNEETGNE